MSSPKDSEKYRRLFIDEARESLALFQKELLQYEKEGDAAQKKSTLDAAFRHAHSLKGMAQAMGLMSFGEVSHRMEDLVDKGRQNRITTAEVDHLLAGADILSRWVDEFDRGESSSEGAGEWLKATEVQSDAESGLRKSPTSAEGTPPRELPEKESAELELKISFDLEAPLPRVRAFIALRELSAHPAFITASPGLSEIKSVQWPKGTLSVRFMQPVDEVTLLALVRELAGVKSVSSELSSEPESKSEVSLAPEAKTLRVRADLLDRLIDSVGELLLTRSRLRKEAESTENSFLHELTDEVERITRDLHDTVVESRMLPLKTLTQRLPRVIRDLTRGRTKSVELVIEGDEIEMDRAILDTVFAPLLHLLRNAIGHAHIGDDARSARGKTPSMRIRFSAQRQNDHVVLILEDDGEGIEAGKIRDRAVKMGVRTLAEVESLSDEETLDLICEPGFSTATHVSEISGRGVGMDAVKEAVEAVSGALRIVSEPGAFCRFEMRLPLSMAIVHVLVVEANTSVLAIPIHRVERAFDLNLSDKSLVVKSRDQFFLNLHERMVPLTFLSESLGHLGERKPSGTAILVQGRAFFVDKIVSQEEVVAKPLGAPLESVPHLSGATLLADGRAAYILEPHRLQEPK